MQDNTIIYQQQTITKFHNYVSEYTLQFIGGDRRVAFHSLNHNNNDSKITIFAGYTKYGIYKFFKNEKIEYLRQVKMNNDHGLRIYFDYEE